MERITTTPSFLGRGLVAVHFGTLSLVVPRVWHEPRTGLVRHASDCEGDDACLAALPQCHVLQDHRATLNAEHK